MIAPVAASGSCPTWIARVSKSSSSSATSWSLTFHPLETEEAGKSGRRAFELCLDVAAHARLRREAADAEHALGPVGLHVGTAHETIAGQEREHVVAELALVLTLVDLD